MTEHTHEFVSALRDIMEVIERDYKGMIIGGMAVIALGYPRVTIDIDSTILVSFDDLGKLVELLHSHGIEPRIENAENFARLNHVLLMRHRASGIDVDISLAMLPFEEDAIFHRQFVDFAGVRIAIPRVEDMVIYKMVASRADDLRDVEELLLRYLDKIDMGKVRSITSQFADLLERPEMMTQLDDLVRRTGQKL